VYVEGEGGEHVVPVVLGELLVKGGELWEGRRLLCYDERERVFCQLARPSLIPFQTSKSFSGAQSKAKSCVTAEKNANDELNRS